MKSMLKNQQSFFIVQKIYYKIESVEERNQMKILVDKNLSYVNDKIVKQKCLAILNDGSINVSSKSRHSGSPESSEYSMKNASSINASP